MPKSWYTNSTITRMHSSRMRTGRSLTVFRSLQPGGGGTWSGGGGTWSRGGGGCTWSGGGVPGPGMVYLVRGGVPGPGGCPWSGGGCTWSGGGVHGPGGVPGPGGCTWSRGGVPGPRGVYLVRGVGGTWSRGGCTWSGGERGCTWSRGGVPGPGGCTWSRGMGVPGQVLPPPVNRMTNRCKNITLAKTSFRPVIIRPSAVVLASVEWLRNFTYQHQKVGFLRHPFINNWHSRTGS